MAGGKRGRPKPSHTPKRTVGIKVTGAMAKSDKLRPCKAVLTDPELLEKIIAELDWINIFTVQSVCRACRSIMQNNPRIKEALFSPTAPCPNLLWTVKTRSLEVYVVRSAATLYEQKRLSQVNVTAALNPVALRLIQASNRERHALAYYEFCNTVKWPAKSEVLRFLLAGASARKMQVTSPPSLRAGLICKNSALSVGRNRYKLEKILVENSDGVTVGDLAFELALHWAGCRDCPIGRALRDGRDADFLLRWTTGRELLARRKIVVC